MLAALAMKGTGHDIPPDAPALCRPARLALYGPGQRGAWTRKKERDEDVVATVLGPRRWSIWDWPKGRRTASLQRLAHQEDVAGH
jgi:hypothetical protein